MFKITAKFLGASFPSVTKGNVKYAFSQILNSEHVCFMVIFRKDLKNVLQMDSDNKLFHDYDFFLLFDVFFKYLNAFLTKNVPFSIIFQVITNIFDL